jgi:hypothetical protein
MLSYAHFMPERRPLRLPVAALFQIPAKWLAYYEQLSAEARIARLFQ